MQYMTPTVEGVRQGSKAHLAVKAFKKNVKVLKYLRYVVHSRERNADATYTTTVSSTLLYESECWTVRKNQKEDEDR